MGQRNRNPKPALFAAALLLASAALTGCSTSSYAGIPLRPGAADPELQELAMRARSGDKQAQLELGIRYEEGRGVSTNVARAEQLYRRAATETGGVRLLHIPVAGSGRISTVPVSGGRPRAGLAEAQRRLHRLGPR